jgi:3-methyladenine DNA glycosylase AlkC
MEKTSFSLKDFLFNRDKVAKIAGEVKNVYPNFKEKEFVSAVVGAFKNLELKERIAWIRENLQKFLPDEYRKAVEILLHSLPSECDPNKTDNDFGDFIYAPYSDFVATHGLKKNDLEFSLKALKQLTTRFSAEDAIRRFINAYPEATMTTLFAWTDDNHYHVRRLASEGTRPRLPWSQKIAISPEAALPILNQLFSDRTRFVTRSVANHLNDISRTHPELVLKTLKKWQNSKKQHPSEMNFIIKHSLRTLIKQGHPSAMKIIGFSHQPLITVSHFAVTKTQVQVGEAVEFSFVITALQPEKILVDYIIHFQDKKGLGKNKKVFKLTQATLTKNQSLTITKKHPLRKNMTTRTYYPGEHVIQLQVNGVKMGIIPFELVL